MDLVPASSPQSSSFACIQPSEIVALSSLGAGENLQDQSTRASSELNRAELRWVYLAYLLPAVTNIQNRSAPASNEINNNQKSITKKTPKL